MAAMGLLQELSEAMTCPICLVYFKDPLMLDCGHNFCQSCVVHYWEESGAEPACPECWKRFPQRDGRPNWQLAKVVQLVKKLWEETRAGVRLHQCKKHRRPLNFFCREDQAPLCVVCKRTKAHRGHAVALVGEVAQELKEKVKAQLRGMEEDKRKRTEELGTAGPVDPSPGHSGLPPAQHPQEHAM